MGIVIGPRVIDAGTSLLSVLISPVRVAAGYPSPAQDYFDGRIDLNEHLIKDITSTYVVRVSGDSMEGAGISDGDELIVNRALDPKDGSVVIAVLDGELTIKRLRITASGVVLQADNPAVPGHPGSGPVGSCHLGRRHAVPAPCLTRVTAACTGHGPADCPGGRQLFLRVGGARLRSVTGRPPPGCPIQQRRLRGHQVPRGQGPRHPRRRAVVQDRAPREGMGAGGQVQQLRALRRHQLARHGAPRPVFGLAGGLQHRRSLPGSQRHPGRAHAARPHHQGGCPPQRRGAGLRGDCQHQDPRETGQQMGEEQPRPQRRVPLGCHACPRPRSADGPALGHRTLGRGRQAHQAPERPGHPYHPRPCKRRSGADPGPLLRGADAHGPGTPGHSLHPAWKKSASDATSSSSAGPSQRPSLPRRTCAKS